MRTIARVGLQSSNNGLFHRFQALQTLKAFSTNVPPGYETVDKKSTNSFESADEFERRIFGGVSGNNSSSDTFFQKLDRLEKARNRLGSRMNEGNISRTFNGLGESLSTLSDGMDGKLMEEATYFEFDPDEVSADGYSFRPDMNFPPGSTYDVKDLDLRNPGYRRPPKRREFETTTEEVLRRADFRNVRFLANFITEAGIIIKRKQTGISAKAQRKVAREIKTARAFGLMPFTTMGTKSFVYGETMEALDKDFESRSFDDRMFVDYKDPLGS